MLWAYIDGGIGKEGEWEERVCQGTYDEETNHLMKPAQTLVVQKTGIMSLRSSDGGKYKEER